MGLGGCLGPTLGRRCRLLVRDPLQRLHAQRDAGHAGDTWPPEPSYIASLRWVAIRTDPIQAPIKAKAVRTGFGAKACPKGLKNGQRPRQLPIFGPPVRAVGPIHSVDSRLNI